MSRERVQEHLPLTPLSFEILLSLADGARHGYGIIKESEERSGEPFHSSTGTLYLAIRRLLADGLVSVAASVADGGSRGARGRAYQLTTLGRDVAAAEAERLAARVHDAQRKALIGDSEAQPQRSSG